MNEKSGGAALDGLIDELAKVFHEPESARVTVLRAGFPPGDLPAFDLPHVFWSRVIRAAVDGKVLEGMRAIVAGLLRNFQATASSLATKPGPQRLCSGASWADGSSPAW